VKPRVDVLVVTLLNRDQQSVHSGNYLTLIESDVPTVVQHTRLDPRQAANALMTTVAFPDI
jgi:hypothetical protein